MKAKLGMSPIAWWNDDLAELSRRRVAGGVPAPVALGRLHRHGDGPPLSRATRPSCCRSCKTADVTLCGGWFSGTLVDEDMAANKDRIQPMIELFKAVDAPCIVYGEVGRSIQGDRSKPLATKPKLSDDEMKAYAQQADRVRRMVRRTGHAARLPPPHGGGGRDRAGARRLHAPFGRGHPAAARRRPPGLRRRRRAARHRQPPRPHQPRPRQGRAHGR